VGKDDTFDSGGWIDFLYEGALLTLNAKTGWREVEIERRTRQLPRSRRALAQKQLGHASTEMTRRYQRRRDRFRVNLTMAAGL